MPPYKPNANLVIAAIDFIATTEEVLDFVTNLGNTDENRGAYTQATAKAAVAMCLISKSKFKLTNSP